MSRDERLERLLLPPKIVAELPLYQRIGWKPHSGQTTVIESRARNRLVAAGRRFGKSEIGGHKLVQEAMTTRLAKPMLDDLGKRREFWIVGPTYSDSEKEFRVMYNRMTKMGLAEFFDRPGTYNDPLGGNMHVSLWGGKFQVHAKSAKHPDSLVGEGLSGAIFAEAAKLKEIVYTKYIRPTLADFGGWSLMTSTPEGKNWFYRMWQRGQDPSRPDWSSFRMPSWRNPYVYRGGGSDEAIKKLRRMSQEEAAFVLTDGLSTSLGLDPEVGSLVMDLTEEAFNQEIGALFTEYVGRVFKEFDEELHVGDFPFNPRWKTYAAVDYGYTNPFVYLLLQVDPHGEVVHVIDELYQEGLTIDDAARMIQELGLAPDGLIAFYPDPASPGDTKILEKELRVKGRGGTGGLLRWRIDAIRSALRERNTHLDPGHIDREPLLKFDRKCKRTIADMLNYRYPDTRGEAGNDPENPMKKDDHGPEALGRFYAGHFGTPDKQARRARQRKANIR